MFNWIKICLRMPWVKAFVAPHNSHHIGVAEILDIVCITCWYIHHLYFVATHKFLYHWHIWLSLVTKTYYTTSTHYTEFLGLCVVPMLAFGDAWFRYIHRHLPTPCRAQHLRKTASLIHIHLQRIRKLLCWQIRQIGAI